MSPELWSRLVKAALRGNNQRTVEAGVLRKDREVFRERVAFRPKQKNLQGRMEILHVADKRKEL